jgi:hypothetical protein
MLPAHSALLRCPHCGAKKEILQLMSGNTFGSTLWSDTKHIAPMLPRVSHIQRCPTCGKYFFRTQDVMAGRSDRYGGGTGDLPLEYLKQALAQLQPTGDDESALRFYILWAFNDRYGDMEQSDIPSEEWEYHMDNVHHLLQMDINAMVRAELHREIGDFEQAIQILQPLEVEDNMKDFHRQLLQQAQLQNRKVFALYGDIQRSALTLDNYKETPYTPSQDDDTCSFPF